MKTSLVNHQTLINFFLFAFLVVITAPRLYGQAPLKEWDQTFGGVLFDGSESEPMSIIATPNGGYLLGGISLLNNTSKGEEDYWIVKIDSSGNKLWDKSFGGDSFERFSSVINTSDGGFLVAGSSNSDNNEDKSEENRSQEGQGWYIDYWVV